MATPYYAVNFPAGEIANGGGGGGGGGGNPDPTPPRVGGIFTSWAGVEACVARQPDARLTLRLFFSRADAEDFLVAAAGGHTTGGASSSDSSAFLSPTQQQQLRPSYSASGTGGGASGGGGGGGGDSSAHGAHGGGGGGGGGGDPGVQNLFAAPPGGGNGVDAPPAARPQPIQAGWLDAQLARLCPGVTLDELQRRALEKVVVRRNNVFLTGSGGVGKSYVTTLIIKLLKEHYGSDYSKKVCVTASTGIASTHIDGTTLHTATGVGVPRSWDNFGRMFGHDKNIEYRWSRHYEVLFVDEISMLSGEMLEALNDTIQQVRRNREPFGGLQVIFVGDFAQLPPVPEDPSYTTNDFVRREGWYFPRHEEFWHMPVISTGNPQGQQQQQQQRSGGRAPRQPRQEVLFTNRGLALQSDVWWNLDLRVIELTRVFRQDDKEFIRTLNRMRKGETTPEDLQWLNHHFYYTPLQRDLARKKEEERQEQEQLQRLLLQQREEEEEEEQERELRYMQMMLEEEGGGEGGGEEPRPHVAKQAKQAHNQSPSSAFAAMSTKEGGGGGGASAAARAPASATAAGTGTGGGGGAGGGGGRGAGGEAAAAAAASKLEPLHLYPKNMLVEERNRLMLATLPTPLEEYDTHDFVYHEDTGAILRRGQTADGYEGRQKRDLKLLLANHTYYKTCLSAEKVKLKLGAKVLLLKNLDLVGPKKLVNGSVGVVVAWAPIDNPHLDEEEVEEKGKEGGEGKEEGGGGGGGAGSGGAQEEEMMARRLSPSPPNRRRREQEHDLVEYKERVVGEWYEANKKRIPVVLFTNGRKKAICPDLLSETIVGVGSTCRIQLPLMIGFAISIHKSQGMTLQEALVDAQECFDGGQTYVAVSRVGPREGLRLARRLGMDSIKVNPTFLLWNRLRETMERRREALLSLLAAQPGEGGEGGREVRRVAGLGMKGLHEEAAAFLGSTARKGRATMELRKAWAALRNALDMLKPLRDERRKEVRIVHWQMLDWWRARNGQKMRALYNVRSPLGIGMGMGNR